jgi:predicted component of type VI protein secretion system
VTGNDLFDAFLDGLQISRAELHPSLDVAEAMHNAGGILREFIEGTKKLLENRADLKTAFRLDQTTVLSRHNNPIKLSQNTGDLVKQLLVGRDAEYLGPRDAVREVCQDLLAHQEAFLDAMTQEFVEFADRFDPEELAASFERSLGRKPLFRLLNEFKYWGHYKDLYPTMTEKGSGRFPQMFAEEFVDAYQRYILEYLREHHLGDALPNVKLEPLSKEALIAGQATAADEPADQTDGVPQKQPGAVLDDITDHSGLNELVNFDDLEAQCDTVVFDDDAGQVKG